MRRVLNCILIPLIELEDSSHVEVDEGFISLASLFGISAYLRFGYMLSLQSCPTLCNPMDRSLPGSSVHGILKARILEWVAIPFSRGSFKPRERTCLSYISSLASGFFTTSAMWEVLSFGYINQKMFMRNCLLLGPGDSDGKESACNAGHLGLIPGMGRSPGDGNSNPLQYFCWRIT